MGMLQQNLCRAFDDHSHLIFDDIIKSDSKPLWNGEDIFMSLVANHLYSQDRANNFAMPWLNVTDSEYAKEIVGVSISGNREGSVRGSPEWQKENEIYLSHKLFRGRLWREGKKRLIQNGLE